MNERAPDDKAPAYKVTSADFDKAVDKYGSAYLARVHLGVTPDEIAPDEPQLVLFDIDETGHEIPAEDADYPRVTVDTSRDVPIRYETQTPPVAVDLVERAVAMKAIADYYNQRNRTVGGRKHVDAGGQNFTRQYGREAGEVQRNASDKQSRMYRGMMNAIDTLTAYEAMMASPDIGDADADLERTIFNRDVREAFGGTGPISVRRRTAIVKKTAKTADRVIEQRRQDAKKKH